MASQTESGFPLRYSQREREQPRRDRGGDVAHIQLILRQKEKNKVPEQENGGRGSQRRVALPG